MASIVRQSKFRHVFGGLAKREATYEGLKVTGQSLDSSLIKVNEKFIAYIYDSSGGGAISIIPITQTGKTAGDSPLISGHSGPVTDLDFSPFNPNVIATTCEDCVVRVWTIPPDGLAASGLSEASVLLKGHGRKPTELNWNPAISNVLASSGVEPKIIVWDAVTGKQLYNIENQHGDIIQSFSWKEDGNLIATQAKDKKVRVFDVRSNSKVVEIPSHVGLKNSKVLWSNQKNWVISPGFGRGSDREVLAWDLKNTAKPIISHVIDQSSGQLLPFLDEATQLLFISSKGEASVMFYELDGNKSPFFFFISKFAEGTPIKGIAQYPKIHVNPKINEITRLYKLTSKATIEPVTFTVPRRSEMFQQDLYPPVVDSSTPAQSLDNWVAGKNASQRLFVYSADGAASYADAGSVAAPKVVVPTPTTASSSSAPLSAPKPSPASSSSSKSDFPVSVASPVDNKSAEIAVTVDVLKQNIAELEAALPASDRNPAIAAARIAQLEYQLKQKNEEISLLKKKVIALGGKN